MRVLLLEHPRPRSITHFNEVAHTPLSSCLTTGYVASLLNAHGYEVEILDSYHRRYSLTQMVSEALGKEYDLVGVHLVYSWEHTPEVLLAVDQIRVRREVPLVAYGFYPTFAYESILQTCRSVDYLIIGEPEETFLELSEKIKNHLDAREVCGLSFRNEGCIIVNKRRKVIANLSQLPFPVRTQEQLDSCGANILGSRGCYGKCTFCYINRFYGNGCRWRGRTPENIYQEVTTVLTRHPQKHLYFIDANFFGPGRRGWERAEKIARLLGGERSLSFGLECRVDNVEEHSLRALVNAGLREVFLGVESGSPRSLKRMRKGTTVEQSVRAINLLRSYGIEPYCGFIMFEPDVKLQDLRDNFNFLLSHHLLKKLICTIDLLYHPQIILMGTESYQTLKRENRLTLSPHSPYQGTFRFTDERVTFFAEVMASICRFLLAHMERSDSPLYWKKCYCSGNSTDHRIDDRLNQWLVAFFGELLTRLEYGEIECTQEARHYYIRESISTIERTINSWRECGLQATY